jgi:hypothetical protein
LTESRRADRSDWLGDETAGRGCGKGLGRGKVIKERR